MTKFEENVSPYLSFVEGAAPSSPAATNFKLYYDSADHLLKWKNSAGSVTTIATGVAAAGACIFLERHAASSSTSLDFTSFISATYDKYLIVGEDLALATNAADLRLEIGTGGGPTYDTGNNYQWARLGLATNGAGNNDSGSTGIARIFKSMANDSGYGYGTFSLTATNLQSTAHRKHFDGTEYYADSTPLAISGVIGLQWTTLATAVTALRFIASSGNITSGSITIYGLTNS